MPWYKLPSGMPWYVKNAGSPLAARLTVEGATVVPDDQVAAVIAAWAARHPAPPTGPDGTLLGLPARVTSLEQRVTALESGTGGGSSPVTVLYPAGSLYPAADLYPIGA